MSNPPQLVIDDPWLEPHQDTIQRRMDRFYKELVKIRNHSHSLTTHAAGHKHIGVYFNENREQWVIREWAPGAKSIHLIGDFNDWDRSKHPLRRIQGGLWELRLPAESMKHEQRVKLFIVGANGSERDRIPSTIRRAIQDPESKDYAGQIWSPPKPYKWKHNFDPSGIKAPIIYECHVGMSGEEARIHS